MVAIIVENPMRSFGVLPSLFPKPKDFFPTLAAISDGVTAATSKLLDLMDKDGSRKETLDKIGQLETEICVLVQNAASDLHTTFVTPFDRVQMFRLLRLQKQAIFTLRMIAERLVDQDLTLLPLESMEIVIKCAESCVLIRKMIAKLQATKKHRETISLCIHAYDLTQLARRLALKSMQCLYKKGMDPNELVKIKDLNTELINLVSTFERIATLIEEVVLENA